MREWERNDQAVCRWCGQRIIAKQRDSAPDGLLWMSAQGPVSLTSMCEGVSYGAETDLHAPIEHDVPAALDRPTVEEWLTA